MITIKYLDLNASNYIILLLIIVIIFILLRYKFIDYRKKRLQKKRFKRGLNLENKAKKVLHRLGYNIVKEQYQCYHTYKVNNTTNKAKIIIDYIVEKNNKQYIVEVKSGRYAISTNNKDTRRQLLEYSIAIKNDGVFLLDMENENLELISFHSKISNLNNTKTIVFIILTAIIGIFIPNINIKIIITLVLILTFILIRHKSI